MTDQTALLEQLETLLSKQEIIEAIHRYARSMDRLDVELGKSVFHPDAVVDYGAAVFQGSGHDFIDWVIESHQGLIAHSHQMSTISIRVQDSQAWTETYADVKIRHRGSTDDEFTDISTVGRYVDRWERRDGRWAIIQRCYLNDFQSTVVSPASKHPMTGKRDRTDASYEGLL